MADYVVEPPGGRLDSYLARRIADISRSAIQSMIREGLVRVNGAVTKKAAHELRSGDTIHVAAIEPEPPAEAIRPIELEIVFESSDYMVVNKPAGVVVHPSPGHERGTLAEAAIAHAPELHGLGESGREGVVHRLDKDTSGLIVFAKNIDTLSSLQRQFKDREVKKTYLALVDDAPPSRRGRVEAPIARDPKHRQQFAVQEGGRSAITEFQISDRYKGHTLVEVQPITGRTHQIRIHMSFLKCPIVGDRVYGRKHPSLAVSRQMLHAWKLGLPDSGNYEVEPPADFSEAIRQASG